MYQRIIDLIGKENFEKITTKKILLVGCGGVGSFAYTALIRSGFLNITVIDKDRVDLTNLNRQLIANLNTIGQNKDNINSLDKDYDYIIDACDTLNTKLELIKFANDNDIKIISAMGLGNRVHANNIKITTLDKTQNDPLARKLRKLVKDNHLNKKITVVFNESLPIKKEQVNSIITSPGIAGLLIVDYIINDIIEN